MNTPCISCLPTVIFMVFVYQRLPLCRFGAAAEDEPEIDDDEFERIRSGLGGKRSSGKAKKK